MLACISAISGVSTTTTLASTVGDDPLQLLGRRGLVDGNRHPTDGHNGVVDEQPLETRVRHERDAVTFLDATRDEAFGELADARVEVAGGHVD